MKTGNRYKVGDLFTATYADAPVPPEKQYEIGQSVGIFDSETGVKLATYVVEQTDGTTNKGKITEVYDEQ